MMTQRCVPFGLILVALLLSGCSSLSSLPYLTQAATGQIALLWAREDIDSLINHPGTEPALLKALQNVVAVRTFASAELALPVGKSYSSYVALGRDYAVWNVFAAPEFSVEPLTYCFPIAGCVAYRGYFEEAAALRAAALLEKDNVEVYVAGVSAYSTLGWFDDPVTSALLAQSPDRVAATLFHELAHRAVYAKGDTTFNESFASVVEDKALERWLEQQAAAGRLEEAALQRQRRDAFTQLILAAQTRFATLYAGSGGRPAPSLDPTLVAELRLGKAQLQAELRADYAELKASWQGYSGYERWFAGPLNNAQLSTVAAYNQLVPQFECLFEQHGSDLEAFIEEVSVLARRGEEASEALRELAPCVR